MALHPQRNPTLGTMAMLVGVATDKIKQFLEPLVAGEMQAAAQWAGGHAIQGEDIDIETAEVT